MSKQFPLDARPQARNDGRSFTEDLRMFALTLALTLGIAPDEQHTIAPDRVFDPVVEIKVGMTVAAVRHLLPRPKRLFFFCDKAGDGKVLELYEVRGRTIRIYRGRVIEVW
jgi:hypothetical protein